MRLALCAYVASCPVRVLISSAVCVRGTCRQRLVDLCHEPLATRTLEVHPVDDMPPSPKTLDAQLHRLHNKRRTYSVLASLWPQASLPLLCAF